jgi:Alpha-glucuronidase
LAVSL